MCGIAGIFNFNSVAGTNRAEIEAMLATMPHRGPDAHGVRLFDARTGFGHLRLSILDLRPESNQPFEIDDGELTITYNGEVFNYLELRDELESLGHRFRTNSDTEVVLRAYRQWGPGALRRFNGMWALAIYDRGRDTLFCARDRFGVKPFNYVVHRGRLIFASEIKAILAAAPDLAVPDYDSLSRLLRASAGARCESTCFEGIKRLRPAHMMTATREGIRIQRYWDFPEDHEDNLSYDEAAAGLRDLLVDAIKLRMRSDVPVGLTLSGGLDSSSIACTLRSFYEGPFDTFTAAYQGEPLDESPRARELASSLGMTANLVSAAPDNFLDTLRKIIWHLESPTHTPAVFPLWNIARLARTKVTVLLEGQGADEVLAGYKFNFYDAVMDRLRRAQVVAAAQEMKWAVATLGLRGSLLLAGRRLNPPLLHKAFRLLRGDERVYCGPLRDRREDPDRLRQIPPTNGRLNASLMEQIEGGLVNLLHYGDAISMAHSLESRVPFLDYRLVEYCVRLPGEFKYRQGRGKAVLRQAMRGLVPDDILDTRAKLGFPVPISRWFREHPERTIYPVLRSPECRSRGIFSEKYVEQAIARHQSGSADLSSNIYRWILAELWFQQFIDTRPHQWSTPREPAGSPPETAASLKEKSSER
jgi:asparagine synthase (glutamine-hydrolysing)